MAAVCQPASAVRLYVGAPREETAVHGRGVRPETRMAARGKPGVACSAVSAARRRTELGARSECLLSDRGRLVRARLLAAGLRLDRLPRCRQQRLEFPAQGAQPAADRARRVQLYAG